jgi:hypothetical protein
MTLTTVLIMFGLLATGAVFFGYPLGFLVGRRFQLNRLDESQTTTEVENERFLN